MSVILCGIFMFHVWFCCSCVQAENKVLFCYDMPSFVDQDGNESLWMNDIGPNMCTHTIYKSVNLVVHTTNLKISLQILDVDNERADKSIARLKTKYPQLKVLVDLNLKLNYVWTPIYPYWTIDPWQKLMCNKSRVDEIAKRVVDFLHQNEFDGVFLKFDDLLKSHNRFMKLISALKNKFLPHGYQIALAGDTPEWRIKNGYDYSILSREVDFLVLHASNFHHPSSEPQMAQHPFPLYRQPADTTINNVDFLVNLWLHIGFSANKIILTIPLWGTSWTLSSSETSSAPAPAKGPGPPQNTSETSGLMTYLEICEAVQTQGWQVFRDDNQTTGPYAVSPAGFGKNRVWVGYDDPAMAVMKSNYILSKGLGGVFVYDVSSDDYSNKCGGGRYPMFNAISRTLLNEMQQQLSNISSVNITAEGEKLTDNICDRRENSLGIPLGLIIFHVVVIVLVILVKCFTADETYHYKRIPKFNLI